MPQYRPVFLYRRANLYQGRLSGPQPRAFLAYIGVSFARASLQRQREMVSRVHIDCDEFGSTISDQVVVVAKTLQSYGHDAEKFVADFGIRLLAEPSPYVRFPAGLMADVWNRAAEICGDPHFAVRAADQIDASFYFLLGPALRLSCSIREALRRFCEYAPVISDALAPTLSETPDKLDLTFHENRGRSSPVVQDVTLSYVMKLARQIHDPATRPVRICLSRGESQYSPELLERLPCSVEFSSPARTIQFACEHRVAKAPAQAPAYDQLLRRYVQMLSRNDRRFADLRVQLRSCVMNSEISLAALADRQHVSKRTLQRSLAERDTSFLGELDAVRCEIALERLCKQPVSITKLAVDLGFYDSSHFSRAVRRWTGLAPRHSRRLLTRLEQ